MRFIVMHKMTEELEQGLPPAPEVIEGVQRLIGESLKEKVFVSGEGLKPSSQRVHLTYANGRRTVTDGPFTGARELVSGLALLRVRAKDEAIACCDRFAEVLGDVEVHLGPVVEPWDLGMAPKPKHPPLRFLALEQVDPGTDGGDPGDPERRARRDALVGELTSAGVLQASGDLASTKHGARIRNQGGKRTVLDGPFAESKELIAGYAIIDVPSKAAAVEWGQRFLDVVHVNEVEIRQLVSPVP